MCIDPDINAEIASQLNHDILYFGWLCQIVRDLRPSFTEYQIVECVLAAIAHLVDDQSIVIGDAKEINGTVQIEPWHTPITELHGKMTEKIACSRDRDFCFWIQLKRHYDT
jgi:hypothetical protein